MFEREFDVKSMTTIGSVFAALFFISFVYTRPLTVACRSGAPPGLRTLGRLGRAVSRGRPLSPSHFSKETLSDAVSPAFLYFV